MAGDWRAELFARRAAGLKFDLAAIRAVDVALGRPGATARHVQVLGTNGKGSTASMLAWSLQRSGLRVGLFTSPHLHRVAERVRIDFQPVSDDELTAAVRRVLAQEAAAARPLSFFEVLTLAAWVLFGQAEVDVIVLEAGLGGRLDATSARPAELVLFTSVGLDHQAFLGPDIPSIAREKLGALQAGQRCVHASLPDAALAEVERARGRGVEFVQAGPAVWAPLPGPHQRRNAGVVREATRQLGVELGDEAWRAEESWRGFAWPGRGEQVARGGGELCFDVAHNPQSIAARVDALREGAGADLVVFGCAEDKDAGSMLGQLERLGAPIWWCPPAGPRGPSTPPAGVSETVEAMFSEPMCARLLAGIEAQLADGGRVLVCGSHFLVAPLRAWALGLGALDMDPPELTDPVFVAPSGFEGEG